MPVKTDLRKVHSAHSAEIYISAVPDSNEPVDVQWQQIFSQIAEQLRSQNARIVQERIFAIQNATEGVCEIRSKAYGDLDDSVAPTILVGKQGSTGPIAGVQVHGV